MLPQVFSAFSTPGERLRKIICRLYTYFNNLIKFHTWIRTSRNSLYHRHKNDLHSSYFYIWTLIVALTRARPPTSIYILKSDIELERWITPPLMRISAFANENKHFNVCHIFTLWLFNNLLSLSTTFSSSLFRYIVHAVPTNVMSPLSFVALLKFHQDRVVPKSWSKFSPKDSISPVSRPSSNLIIAWWWSHRWSTYKSIFNGWIN